MQRDVFLVTIDCWRADAPHRMDGLESLVRGDEWVERRATSQAASTMWVFPQIFTGQHYLDAFDIDGSISVGNASLGDDVVTLPDVLSEHGYETGAFAASNPNLELWSDRFDVWHNRDLERFPNASSLTYEFDYYSHLLLQRPRVNAGEVAAKARDWFTSKSEPRFCWMHLMEPHSPYYAGLKKATEVGLLDAYHASYRLARGNKRELLDRPDAEQLVDTLEELYYKSIERLDERLSAVFSFVPDNAIVVLMGDHGEEFHHGWLEHTRLYDECVRVPFYSKHLAVPNRAPRQLDVAPSLLDELGLPIPDQWDGIPFDSSSRPSYMVESGGGEFDYVYTGIRTDDRKIIESRPKGSPDTIEQVEAYDLMVDPHEKRPLDGDDDATRAAQTDLHRFLESTNHEWTRVGEDEDRDLDPSVERRLSELGYK